MYKILHSADWHLGQNFFGYDRKKEHIIFLDWLNSTIQQNQIDALLIAGDIFDTSNPSAESQRLFYQFLWKITQDNPHLQIVLIAGNHDSAARIESTNPILEAMNIQVVGTVTKDENGDIEYDKFLIPLRRENEIYAWCIAIPYLRQGDYPKSPSYTEGVEAMYDAVYQYLIDRWDTSLPVVFMGHLHASGSVLSQDDRSERVIVGGVESISPTVFIKEHVVYTALGHLHRSQAVGGGENIRYSGSPLPMSFAEKDYKQGIDMIGIESVNNVEISRIAFEPPVPLISMPHTPAPLDEVLVKLQELPNGDPTDMSPFLEVKVLLTQPEPGMKHQIEEALKNKNVRFVSAPISRIETTGKAELVMHDTLKTIQPMEMAEDVFKSEYGDAMPDTLKALLSDLIRDIKQ